MTHPALPPQPRPAHLVSAAVRRLAAIAMIVGTCAELAHAAQPPAPVSAPNATTIDRVAVWRHAGVTSLSLSNGIDAHLRPMSRPGAGKVVIAAMVPGLELDETADTRGTAMLAVDALKPAGGEVKLRAQQRSEGLLLTASCSADKVPAALRQIAATISEPEFDKPAFEEARERALAQLARAEERPDNQAAEAMLKLMAPVTDARLRRPTREQLNAVTFERASETLRTLLRWRAVDVAVVGDADPGALTPLIAESLGPLPARPRPSDRLADRRAVTPLLPPPGQTDVTLTGPRPLLAISLPAPALEDLTESRRSAVAARLLERQLAEALRDSGLTVTVSAGVAMTGRTYPDMGAVIGSFILAGDDQHLRAAASVARTRVAHLIEDGPTLAELQRAIDDAVGEVDPRIQTPDYWAQALVVSWFLRVPIDQLDTAPAAMRQTTRQALRQHMARWWTPEKTLTVTILPTPERPGPKAEPAKP